MNTGGFEEYTTGNGLVGNDNRAVVIDRDDNVWSISDRGINMFDGVRWHGIYDTLFRYEVSASVDDDGVTFITRDSDSLAAVLYKGLVRQPPAGIDFLVSWKDSTVRNGPLSTNGRKPERHSPSRRLFPLIREECGCCRIIDACTIPNYREMGSCCTTAAHGTRWFIFPRMTALLPTAKPGIRKQAPRSFTRVVALDRPPENIRGASLYDVRGRKIPAPRRSDLKVPLARGVYIVVKERDCR